MSQMPESLRHVLLATTGESPQVVTETLYAIYQQNLPWPDEIRLITTSVGKARAQKGLLDEGHLQRLCDEIDLAMPSFDTDHIEVVPDAQGRPVDDARSLEDHEALGDFIMTRVSQLTANSQLAVHASLAGGRKTMTFYLGYAMSLFGRGQDRLSHVLVSQGYESLSAFWYPSAHQGQLINRDGQIAKDSKGQPLLASHANVTLAMIPFVRHRHNLPAILPQRGNSVNFRELVRLINLGEQPAKIQLTLDMPERKVTITDLDSDLLVEISLSPLNLSFLAMVAKATKQQEFIIYRPSGTVAAATGTIIRDRLLDELLLIYEQPRNANLEQRIQSLRGLLRDDTLNSFNTATSGTWFDQRRNDVARAFAEQLPSNLAQYLSPVIVWDDDGKRLEIPGSGKNGCYGIPLPAEQIVIKDCEHVRR